MSIRIYRPDELMISEDNIKYNLLDYKRFNYILRVVWESQTIRALSVPTVLKNGHYITNANLINISKVPKITYVTKGE